MSKYSAAVIIPTRGGAARLHHPLDSLIQQTEKDFQVIVVIDGDIDNSAGVVQEYIDRGELNLSMIVFEENRGRVAALNAGHQAADATVLIRCDDDLAPEPHYISQHLKHYQEGGLVGVIGLYKNIFPDTPYSKVYGNYRDQKFREDAYTTAQDRSWIYWAGNVSMTKDLFDQLGGYDPRYRLYGWEDVDMGYMAYKAGAKIIIDPDLETNHYVAATTTAIRAKRALYSGAARNLFVKKHGLNILNPVNPRGIWGLALRLVASVSTEKTIQLMGKVTDQLLPYLPQSIGEKLVSLVVESASYAGINYPQRAQKKF